MAPIIKRKTVVGIGRETTFQTESTQLVDMGVQNIAVDIQKNVILNDQMYGRIEDTRDSRIGTKMSQVTLTGIVEAAFWGQFLMAAFGTLNTTADSPESGANTHAFTVNNTNQADSYSITYEDDNQDMVCLGCRLTSLQTTVVAGDWVTYTATFIGNPPTDASETASFSDDHLFSADQATVRFAAVGGSFSGAGIKLSTLDLTVEKNAEAHFAFGANTPDNIINKQFSVTGSFTLLWEDETYFDLFNDHTLRAMEISLSGGTIPSTSTAYSTKFTLEQIHFDGWNNNGNPNDKVEQTITFKAEYKEAATANMITAELINDQANSVY